MYEEIYATQITSLQDLGFTDLSEIITALRNADGQLEQAIDFLFTKQTKEVIHISPPNSERIVFYRTLEQTQKTAVEQQTDANQDENLLDGLERIDQQNELIMIQERLLLERERLQMEQDTYRRREQDLKRFQEQAMEASIDIERAALKAKQREIEKCMAAEEAAAMEEMRMAEEAAAMEMMMAAERAAMDKAMRE